MLTFISGYQGFIETNAFLPENLPIRMSIKEYKRLQNETKENKSKSHHQSLEPEIERKKKENATCHPLSKHLRNAHQRIHTLRNPLTLHATPNSPGTRPSSTTTTQCTSNPMRQPQPNHSKKLRQNAARQQRDNNQQEHLDGILAGEAVDIPEELLNSTDDALHKAIAWPGSTRRPRKRRENRRAGTPAPAAAEAENGRRGVSGVVSGKEL